MTAMAIDGDATRPPLDIGPTVSEVVATCRRNFKTFALLALVWFGLPEVVAGLIMSADPTAGIWATGWTYIPNLMAVGGFAHVILAQANGRRSGFGLAQGAAYRNFAGLWGVAVLTSIGIVLGMLLLVVPGIILALAWSQSSVVRMANGPGVKAAIGDSAKLTRNYRWAILAIYLIFGAPLMTAYVVLSYWAGEGPIGALLVGPLTYALMMIPLTACAPVIYLRLRRIKGGAAPEGLAAVFD